MKGFGVSYEPTLTNTKLIPEHFEELKKSVRNLYWRPNKQGFNDKVVSKYIREVVGDYGDFLNNRVFTFDTFRDLYDCFVTSNKEAWDNLIQRVYEESRINQEWRGITRWKVEACFICRLGNAYFGMNKEEEIIKLFNSLEGVSCHKAGEETDINFKVDCVLELLPFVRVALQIKPISRLNYDEGNEKEFHHEFSKKTGLDVLYLYYGKSSITINNIEVDIKDKTKILDLVYSL